METGTVARVAASRAVPGGRSRFNLGRVGWVAGQVFSFETAFLLFIFASVYTADPRLAWFPGDMTLFFFGFSVAIGSVPLLRGSLLYFPGIKAVWAGVTLVLWIAASQAWSPSHAYATEKVIAVVGGNLWCLTATALIIASSRVRVWRFLVLLLIFGVVLAVDFAINADFSAGIPRDERSLTNYLLIGRLVGLAALIAFALWLRSPPRSARGVILLVCFAVCGYALLKGGGRNPMIAVVVGMLIPLLLSFRLPRGQLIISRRILASLGLIGALALVVAALAISDVNSLRTLQRFDTLVSKIESGEEANPRTKFWRRAMDYWADSPLVGHGVGAWPVLYMGRDQRHYPHNIILELLVETGLVGLVLFTALVLVLAQRAPLRRLREDPALMLAFMLCTNAFVNSMTTGDLADNRNLFAMLGLLAMRLPNSPADAGTESRPLSLETRFDDAVAASGRGRRGPPDVAKLQRDMEPGQARSGRERMSWRRRSNSEPMLDLTAAAVVEPCRQRRPDWRPRRKLSFSGPRPPQQDN